MPYLGASHSLTIGHMGQHTGATGADTAWLSFQADAPYDWMSYYGDRLCDVRDLLHQAGRGPHAVLQ